MTQITLALIAHDGKKDLLIELAKEFREELTRWHLVTTKTTGDRLEAEVGLIARKVLSGPKGGDLQIGAEVATGQVAAVLFFRDPLTAHAHEPDIAALMKVCDVHNVPLATNAATARFILEGLQ